MADYTNKKTPPAAEDTKKASKRPDAMNKVVDPKDLDKQADKVADEDEDGEVIKPSKDQDNVADSKQPEKAQNRIKFNPKLDAEISDDGISYETQPALTGHVNEALNQIQRQHRAMAMKRIAPKLKRAREIAQHRRADDAHIQLRAMRTARDIIRQRIIGANGKPYSELDTATKTRIDTMMGGKADAVKKLAVRLIPAVRKAEMDRLSNFNHKDMVSQPKAHPQVNEAYDRLDGAADIGATTRYKKVVVMGSDGKRRIVNRAVKIVAAADQRVNEAIANKAKQSGLSEEVILGIYETAISEYNPYGKYSHLTPQQYAFGTINKAISDWKNLNDE